jgi:hypothetical protein
MSRIGKIMRRALGGPLSALMLFVGAAGPFLDAADLLAETHLVSGDASTSTRVGHDHRLCIQVGANAAVVSHPVLPPAVWPIRAHDAVRPAPARLPAGVRGAPTARAPPSR